MPRFEEYCSKANAAGSFSYVLLAGSNVFSHRKVLSKMASHLSYSATPSLTSFCSCVGQASDWEQRAYIIMILSINNNFLWRSSKQAGANICLAPFLAVNTLLQGRGLDSMTCWAMPNFVNDTFVNAEVGWGLGQGGANRVWQLNGSRREEQVTS